MRWGFALFEVLVVIMLFSIITAFSLSFIRVTDTAYVRAELEKLRACMLYVQARACSEQKQKVLTFNLKEHSYTADTQCTKLTPAVRFGIRKDVKGPPSDAVYTLKDSITFVEHKAIFYPDGTISSGAVYLTDHKHSCLYALTSGISQVPYLRRYTYKNRWILLE